MATYVLGDLQGCLADFDALLNQIAFSPDEDELLLAGDLVNRGPDSLGTLRRVYALRDNVRCVLGNHDLHLLAHAYGGKVTERGKPLERDLQAIIDASDGSKLLDWLRRQPLIQTIDSPKQPACYLLHAGLPPQWTIATAKTEAKLVENALRQTPALVFDSMYGNQPDHWDGAKHLAPDDPARLRFTINCLTRLRYCGADGHLLLKAKSKPGEHPPGAIPWFQMPDRRSAETPILFGHWSTLDAVRWPDNNVIGLDTGCVWGGRLSALRLEDDKLFSTACQMHREPG